MTFTWRIDGLGTASQTLVVEGPDGAEIYTERAESFSWTGDHPEPVFQTVVNNDVQAALAGDIERAQN